MSGRVLDKLSRLVRVFDIFEKARKLELPWIIMYSGGKDSTLVLHLAASYALVMGLEKPVYVVYNESYLDPPPVRNWIYRHLSAVSEWSEETGIPFRVVVIEPPPGKDFFSLVFERGYAFPRVRRHAPWCTKEMKTRPTARFFRSKGLRKVVYVTGLRMKESTKRRLSMLKFGISKPLVKTKVEYFGETWYMAPLYDWDDSEVIRFLAETPSPFGDSYEPLLELYQYYSVGGKLRTGCWTCSLVSRDWFLEKYAEKHPEYKVVIEVKNKMIAISENPRYRTAISKNGYPAGRITFEGRRKIFELLAGLLDTKVGRELMKPYLEKPELRKKLKEWSKMFNIPVNI